MSRIYKCSGPEPVVDVPKLDLLTFLFDSEYSVVQDNSILHVEADDPSNKITKADLRSLTQRVAHALRYRYGIGANGPSKDVVTVMSYGQILIPAAFFGVLAAGGVYSAASPSSTVTELARQITIGTSNLVICSSEFKDVVSKAVEQSGVPLDRVLVLASSPSWSLATLDGNVDVLSSETLSWPRITGEAELKNSLITILWSSGTTGLPKGVMLSHTNLVAETYITAYSGRTWAAAQLAADPKFQFMEYRTLAHLPISHIAGLFGYLIAPFYSGGTVFWMRRYSWPGLLKHAKQYRITAFYTVPSIYLRISKSPEVTDHFAHVEAASTGAAPMDGVLMKATNSKLGADGSKGGEDATYVGQTWGLSETTGAVTMMPKGQRDVSGSVSPILPNVELRIVDESFNDVEPGQPGEMLVRSILVTNGYFNNPEATKDAFHEDWFCTGDIAIYKDGKFYIVDRKKELLKYKGQQVAPAEIENLLFIHPLIAEAAVVGVKDPSDPGNDLPRAYVVADPAKVSAEQIKAFVAEGLAPYKQLRGGVVFVSELPKNAIGKYLRRELRERAVRELAEEMGKQRAKL